MLAGAHQGTAVSTQVGVSWGAEPAHESARVWLEPLELKLPRSLPCTTVKRQITHEREPPYLRLALLMDTPLVAPSLERSDAFLERSKSFPKVKRLLPCSEAASSWSEATSSLERSDYFQERVQGEKEPRACAWTSDHYNGLESTNVDSGGKRYRPARQNALAAKKD